MKSVAQVQSPKSQPAVKGEGREQCILRLEYTPAKGTVAAWGVAGEVDRAQRCLAGEAAIPVVLNSLRFFRLFEMLLARKPPGPGTTTGTMMPF